MTNYNIALQCIGLLLVVLLVAFIKKRKTLRLITDYAFNILIAAVTVSICLDILSIITINQANIGAIPDFLNLFVCKSYIVSLTLVALAVFFYALTEIYSGRILKKKALIVYLVLEAVTIIAIYALPLSYYIDEESIYSYGLSTNVGVGTGLIFLVLPIIYLMSHRKGTDRMRRYAIALFCVAMTFSASFQNFNRRHLIASLTIGICTIFIYMSLEDPSSYIDRATGVFNRPAMKKYMGGLISQEKKFSVICVSMIGYRFLQDLYGDALYEKLTREMVSYFERFPNATVFSTGGADYAVVFSKVDSFDTYIRKIRQDFAQAWHIENADIEFNTYIVAYPHDRMENDPDKIYATLRYFMTDMKEKEERNYLYIDAAELKIKEADDRLRNLLESAIDNDDFEVYYVPMYDGERKVVGGEAIARIRNANGEAVLDDELLPAAERSGIILRLGIRIFEMVCRFIRDHDMQELGILRIGINLSAAQCMQRNMAEDLIGIMQNYGVDGNMFVFEVTGGAIRYAGETLMENMNRLIANGSEVSLDRFGKKGGSLMNLIELPITVIKIDRVMIAKCFAGKEKHLTKEGRALIAIIRQFGKKVSAVGVESKEEFEELKQAGIDFMQGGYFSKAVDEAAFIDLCRQRKV